MRKPRGIAIHQDNLYVTYTGVQAVFRFKIEVDMRLVAMLGSRGSGMGQFNSPDDSVSTNGVRSRLATTESKSYMPPNNSKDS